MEYIYFRVYLRPSAVSPSSFAHGVNGYEFSSAANRTATSPKHWQSQWHTAGKRG